MNRMNPKLSSERREELLSTLKARFEKNMNRHKNLEWAKVQAKLEVLTEKLWSLGEMERTGGEPDVVGFDKATHEYIFYDCSAERYCLSFQIFFNNFVLPERMQTPIFRWLYTLCSLVFQGYFF